MNYPIRVTTTLTKVKEANKQQVVIMAISAVALILRDLADFQRKILS